MMRRLSSPTGPLCLFRSLRPSWSGTLVAFVLLAFLLPVYGVGRLVHAQSANEFSERRARLASQLDNGLIILPAAIEEKGMMDPGWIQEPSFQYFTGLLNIPGAILAIDVPSNTHVLFSAGAPSSFRIPIPALDLLERPDLIEESGIDAVLPMDRFVTWVSQRLQDPAHSGVIYLSEPRSAALPTTPMEMPPVANWSALWRYSLTSTFPEATFGRVTPLIVALRWQKSESEIQHLRRNARASAEALKAGMRAVQHDRMQREAESAVVATCLENGMEGPSFWPWVMSGPNAHLSAVVGSFFDYSHLNRPFEKGDLVRVDVGCMSGGYGGDVGRTIPVSGTFSEEQGRIWDLMIAGYTAGVEAMKPGVTLSDVAKASNAAIRAFKGESASLDDLIDALTSETGIYWHIHGVGIESGEAPGSHLVEGAVLAFEPMVSKGDQAYYLEDMWVITDTGAELLTPGLPTTRQEIEAFLTR